MLIYKCANQNPKLYLNGNIPLVTIGQTNIYINYIKYAIVENNTSNM
jgi:hypothetical protein